MSSDRFGAHWLSSTAPAPGGSGANAGRQQQMYHTSQQQQQQLQQQGHSTSLSPPPLRPTSGAFSSHASAPPFTSAAPPATATTTPPLASSLFGVDVKPSASSTSSSLYTGSTSKHVNVEAGPLGSGNPAGYRSMGNAAPYTQTQPGGHYRPPMLQQQHQQPPQPYQQQALRGPHHVSLVPSNVSVSSSSRSVHDSVPAYKVSGPTVTGMGGSGYVHWRGGGHGGSGDHARRRSEGGRSVGGQGENGQASRRQQQQQQQQQQQHGRPRGGLSTEVDIHARVPASTATELPSTHMGSTEGEGRRGPPEYSSTIAQHVAPNPTGPAAAPPATTSSVADAAAAAAAATSRSLSHGGGPSVRRGSGSGPGRHGGMDLVYTQHTTPTTTGITLPSSARGAGGAEGFVSTTGSASASASAAPFTPTATSARPPSQLQVSSAGVSRTGASPSTGATRLTRLPGEERPTVALSQNVMAVYQAINEIFYEERQKLLAPPATGPARKYEDTSGHYVPCEGEVIADRYVFKELVGQGSFGKVLHCIDRKYNEPVAVKVIRCGPYFESQGWFEAQVVAHLNNDASLQNLVVQLRKVFLWKGHMVLVFEPLSFSLYKLITLTKHNGVSLDLTRKFAYQMVKVLLVLEQHQPPIIHCDLKPENVLLRDPSRSGVRVIDFGSACYQQQTTWRLPPAQVPLPASSPSASAGPPWDAVEERRGGCASAPAATPSAASRAAAATATAATTTTTPAHEKTTSNSGDASAVGPGQAAQATTTTATATATVSADVEVVMPKYIQSRYYRSPEVILELGYTTSIDRWSLGCFLAEMHTGRPLFQGNNEADMIAYFTMVLGPLPDYMIASSPKRTRLYHTCPMENGGEGSVPPTTNVGSGGPAAGMSAAQALLRQQRAASPLLAFTTSPSPLLTPFTDAPGHAPGSPFFLRAAQVEDAASATAYAVRSDGDDTPLEKVLGVHTGGPRGCRAGQPGHDEAAYETFYDFIAKLLQYDPRKRLSCTEAMQHPFLEPIRILEARAAAAAAAGAGAGGAAAAAATPSTSPPVSRTDAAPVVAAEGEGGAPPLIERTATGTAAGGDATVPPAAETNRDTADA